MLKTYNAIYAAWLTSLLLGCTSLGSHDVEARARIDYGPEEVLRICVLLDQPEISKSAGVQLIQAVNNEFSLYGIRVEVPWYQNWQRPSGMGIQTIKALAARKLTPPCDRLLALAGDNMGDILTGILGVSELGSVDTVTHTRGYVLSDFASLNQVFTPPQAAAVHESYHLLGCDHDITMTECYVRIARLKAAASQNRAQGNDFFPTYTRTGNLLLQRDEVDIFEAAALRVQRSKEQ